MSDTILIAAMGTVIVAVVGVVWGLMRGEIAELKGRVISAERLTNAIDEFDTRIGAQIERLSRIVEGQIRRVTPSPRSYIGAPLKREEEDK